MRRILASSLVVLSALGNTAIAQQTPSMTPASTSEQDKPRVYVTDSNSWSSQGLAGGSNGSFAASSSGGARPQTAEIIKTFAVRCPQVTVNNRVDSSSYIVELDHEGGKGVFAHKDKIAVFVQRSGDSIFSKSTLSVGGSVKDACAAVLAHWAIHSTELKAVPVGYGQGGYGVGGYGGTQIPATPVAQVSTISIDASIPNCDIEVDGSFVGSTPSTLNLAPGKHEILVKKAGYEDWSRNMMVGSGSVRLNADMIAKK
jgi:hypothetical protein